MRAVTALYRAWIFTKISFERMDNLSFHLTDITANSIRAGATRIEVDIQEKPATIIIRISDNGCGMDTETIQRVTNPFYTTRTTRKVGLGLPFLIQNAEQTGGKVSIDSHPGKGTEVIARFVSSHIDCPPWGDLAGTIAMLLSGTPDVNICFTYRKGEEVFALSTEEVKEALDGLPLSHPKVISWLKEMIRENLP